LAFLPPEAKCWPRNKSPLPGQRHAVKEKEKVQRKKIQKEEIK
jgi:hypothetical protein